MLEKFLSSEFAWFAVVEFSMSAGVFGRLVVMLALCHVAWPSAVRGMAFQAPASVFQLRKPGAARPVPLSAW